MQHEIAAAAAAAATPSMLPRQQPKENKPTEFVLPFLTTTHFQAIAAGKWLSADVVNFVAYHCREASSIKARYAASLQDTERVTNQGAKNSQRITLPFEPVTQDGMQPIVYESHWYLVVWRAATNTVLVLNSLYEEAQGGGVLRHVDQLFASYIPQYKSLLKWILPQKQMNGDDCGLFVLAWMMALLAGHEPTAPLPSFDQQQMRSHLLQCLQSKIYTRTFPLLAHDDAHPPEEHQPMDLSESDGKVVFEGHDEQKSSERDEAQESKSDHEDELKDEEHKEEKKKESDERVQQPFKVWDRRSRDFPLRKQLEEMHQNKLPAAARLTAQDFEACFDHDKKCISVLRLVSVHVHIRALRLVSQMQPHFPLLIDASNSMRLCCCAPGPRAGAQW